jgi:hypothetical protein
MKDAQTIDTMPIEEVRAGFGTIMAEIVTGYGDDATQADPVASGEQDQGQGQQQKSEGAA